ncbi:hypothetical protein [Methanorbis furvi]|uniref:DUF3821 domain-containing protein n=1 Tax=Methanorbis furvi TaxID=3028299 RepID=A0AAE4ME03_9EURY|nr:hypothetical protein [Methanocorpusculaceae archaeon Ag1]
MIKKRSSFTRRMVFCACVLLIFAALAAPASADTVVAQGDPFYVSGQAPGAQQVALYFFGPNYFKYTKVQVNGGLYSYELQTTADMSPSEYYCVVQSPGTGSTFSVGPVTEGDTTYITVNPGSGVPADGSSFVVVGPNALQSSQAAYALVNMINSPNIPDLCQTFTFQIAYPLITINPVGTQYMGTPFIISGTTNLAVGDVLSVEVTIFNFWPSDKEVQNAVDSSSWSQGTSGQTIVLAGPTSGQNVWSYSVVPLHPSDYEVSVTGIKTGASATQEFVVSDQSPVVPTAAPTALPTLTPSTAAPVPTQTPGFGILAVVGMFGAALLILRRS